MTTVYKFKATFTKSGAAEAPSSAPTIAVVGVDNTVLVAAATATTSLANLPGTYVYSYSGADGLDPIGRFTTTDTSMDQTTLDSYTSIETREILAEVEEIPANPLLANDARLDNLDAEISTRSSHSAADVWAAADRRLTGQSASVTVTGPVVLGGGIRLVPGDDYYAADGRELEWASALWPDLTGATSVEFVCGTLKKAVTVITSGAGVEQKVRLELTSEESRIAKLERQEFKIKAVLLSGHVVTIVQANIMARQPGE